MDFELSEELKMVQRLAKDFVDEQLKPLERDILGRSADLSDARAYLPPEKEDALIKTVKDMGLWGLGVPEDLGGPGLSALGVCVVEEELGRTVTPFRFGDVTPVLFECTPEQQEKFLKPALDNRKRPYLALLEKDGSDPKKMLTKAEKHGADYVINGEKISLSRPGDDYFAIVFASAEKGATGFLVDKDTPGFTVESAAEISGWLSRLRQPLASPF